jgi:glyoxylase I family protein
MLVEHIAFLVDDPVAMTAWYREHLQLVPVREDGAPNHTRFLADGSGQVVLEVYHRPELPRPNYGQWHALQLHIAFVSQDVTRDRDRLLAAGATIVDDVRVTPSGDTLCMLRDPFGLCIQLCRRVSAVRRA